MLKIVIILFSFFCSASFSYSSEKHQKRKEFNMSVGAATMKSKSPYKYISYKYSYLPMLSIRYKNLNFRGPSISYNLLGSIKSNHNLSLVSSYQFNRYKSTDSPIFEGMGNRRGGLYIGAKVKYKVKPLNLEFKIMKDVSGYHGGIIGTMAIGPQLPPLSVIFKYLPFTIFNVRYSLKLYDSTYMNYFYGVQSQEVKVDRPKYSSSLATSNSFNTFIRVSIQKNLALIAVYEREYLSRKIKQSPLVDKSNISSLFISISYDLL